MRQRVHSGWMQHVVTAMGLIIAVLFEASGIAP